MDKKTWITPKFITLVRNKPEETVLSVCKLSAYGYGTPATVITGCNWSDWQGGCISPPACNVANES